MNDHGKDLEPHLEADVAIAGAGPAGLTLALLLLRSGCRVALVERARSFDREFRGEILQPGGLALLDSLGVLDGARARGACELDGFQLVDGRRRLMEVDYRTLPPPYNLMLSLPQPHLLEALLSACHRHRDFTRLTGSVNGLLTDGETVRGVRYKSGGSDFAVRARVTVGADGRYSKVRKLANFGYTRDDVFHRDVLWFKVPADGRPVRRVSVRRGGGGPVLIYDAYPDSIQLGWTLPHKSYQDIAALGLDHVKGQIMHSVPEYADAIERTVQKFTDLTLLDVFSGTAQTWARDGLVLVGDSAHTHSPIGAQGINLAIQDAVRVHPEVLASVHDSGDGGAALRRYARDRRPDIDSVMKLQARQTRAMLSTGGAADRIRPLAARLFVRSPAFRRIRHRIAFGPTPVEIRRDLMNRQQVTGNAA